MNFRLRMTLESCRTRKRWTLCGVLVDFDSIQLNVWFLKLLLKTGFQSNNFLTIFFFLQATLAEMFKLEKQSVHAIVAKMIISEELMASMDEPSECMVMHRTEPSRLQALSLQLSDKLAQLVENNERLLELRPGGKYTNLKNNAFW